MRTISFVIPCCNEREGAPQLISLLGETRDRLRARYATEVVFVDDGSTDGTAERLEALCAGDPTVRVVRHPRNRGLGAALRTGFAHATGDLIVTTDSDCTYDPRELAPMLARLEQGADVVVASPYHPQGAVRNVPAYRLFLSRNLSRLYNAVLRTKIYTYTSLFRVCRAQVIRTVPVESDGFVAMAEMLAEAIRQGYRVAEHPAELAVRQYGASKAVIAQLIADHARFLIRLIVRRSPPRSAAQPPQDLIAWNRRLNESHGMGVLEDHPNRLVRWHERSRKRGILAMAQPTVADTVVEVGCERGTLSASLAGRCRLLVCVDIDWAVVRAAQERLGGPDVAFVVADAQQLPFRDGWADIAVSACVLGHLPDPGQGLRELARIARPDGALVINVPNDRWMVRLKQLVLAVPGARRWFAGISDGLAPGHLWPFDLGFLKQLARGVVRIERVAFNPPYFTNLFVTARPAATPARANDEARREDERTVAAPARR